MYYQERNSYATSARCQSSALDVFVIQTCRESLSSPEDACYTDSDKIVEKMANQIKPMILWKSNDTFSHYSSVLVLPYDDDWPNSGLSRILLDYAMQSLSNVYPIFTQHVSNVSPEDCQNPNLVKCLSDVSPAIVKYLSTVQWLSKSNLYPDILTAVCLENMT